MYLQSHEVKEALTTITDILEIIILEIERYNSKHKIEIYTDYSALVIANYMFIDSHIYYLSTVDKCKGNKLDCFKSALTIINSLSDPNFMLYKRLTSKEPGEIYFMIYHTLNRLRSTTRDLPIKNRLINYIDNNHYELEVVRDKKIIDPDDDETKAYLELGSELGNLNCKRITSLFDKEITIHNFEDYYKIVIKNDDEDDDYNSDEEEDYIQGFN